MTENVLRVLTFEGCPHAKAALQAARAAIARSGLEVDLVELDLAHPSTPPEFRTYPSPTVLVGMRDVAGRVEPVQGLGCRASGAPTAEQITIAVRDAWGGST